MRAPNQQRTQLKKIARSVVIGHLDVLLIVAMNGGGRTSVWEGGRRVFQAVDDRLQ
jgi:hypothetical protein